MSRLAILLATASLVAGAPWEKLGPKNIAECAAEPDDRTHKLCCAVQARA
jgi:hypothetical protein